MTSRTTWYILIPFAVSGLLLIVGVSGTWYVHRVNRHLSARLDANLAAAQSAERLVLGIRDLRVRLDRFVDTGEVTNLEAAIASEEAVEQELLLHDDESWTEEFVERHYEDILPGWEEFRRRFRQLDGRGAVDEAVAATRDQIGFLNEEILKPAEALLDERQDIVTATSRRNQAFAGKIGIGLLLLGICGAVAGLLIGVGITRDVHLSLVEISLPVRDIAGRLTEVVGPIRVSASTDLSNLDDSLRILAEKTSDVVEQLQRSQRRSIRREQLAAVGQLAAGLAHELRNPLMSIKLIVQTAAERADEPLHERDLAIIEDEITRLERMLQTFLDFARPPSPEKQTVNVGVLVEKAAEVIQPRAERQNVGFHVAVADESLSIEADGSQMRQVLLNHLLNALDVLPAGGNVWLEVERTTGPAEDGPPSPDEDPEGESRAASHAVIRVSDDGPGLSAEIADRLFDPFVSTKLTGIGLGLTICRQIVESHDGRLTARNRRRGGAEFTIRLPVSSPGPDVLVAEPTEAPHCGAPSSADG